MNTKSEETQEQFRKRCLSEAGVSYSLAALLPVVLSFILSLALSSVADVTEKDWYRYLSYLLPQLCLAATAAIYFFRSKEPLHRIYRGCKWYWFLIALLLQFGLLVSLSELNNLFIGFLKGFGYEETSVGVPNLAGWNLLPAILVIALLPALFEETIFRGILTRNMQESGWGFWAAALLSGGMFSLFHGNPSQTLYQFACGICFALVALRSRSVFPTMVAHFCNNAVILAISSVYGDVSISSIVPRGGYIALCVLSALCLVGAVLFLALFRREKGGKGIKWGKVFFLAAAVGFFICAVEWIVTLVLGFSHA